MVYLKLKQPTVGSAIWPMIPWSGNYGKCNHTSPRWSEWICIWTLPERPHTNEDIVHTCK